MRYILLFLFLLHVELFGLDTYSFEELRQDERVLVLKEFKALYKVRKNMHYSMRQVLYSARAKSLHKNSLSFFQAKHPLELSTVYTNISQSSEENAQTEQTQNLPPPINNDSGVSGSTTILDTSQETTVVEVENTPVTSGVRGGVKSPWARR